MTTPMLPGLTVTLAPAPAPAVPDPLRTDVAVLLGRTTRGPVGVPVRVASWNEVLQSFGPPGGDAATPHALHGFFENGGRVAWVIRVAGSAAQTAGTLWTVGEFADGTWGPDAPARGGFGYARYQVLASSAGSWANNTRVTIRFQASSVAGPPTLTVRVVAPGEPAESFADLAPAEVADRLAASRLIRLVPDGPPVPASATAPTGPLSMRWDLVLGATPGDPRGTDAAPSRDDYLAAIDTQAGLPEPALVALPDLGTDLDELDWTDTLLDLLAVIDPLHDRLAIVDLPVADPSGTTGSATGGSGSADAALAWVSRLTGAASASAAGSASAGAGGDSLLRAGAVYHPGLLMPDPLGTPGGPPIPVPASGHVLGLIARLDLERGAHHTPANAVLLDAVDLTEQLPDQQQVRLFNANVNLLRCGPGRGLQVWGGRTLAAPASAGAGSRYVAHRRLIHLLVRAIHGAADPLVFDVNGPELRLALVRAITSVLLEAFRSGALAGTRPEQAFRVKCDEDNNPPTQDPGQVVCDIEVVPANPMEFINLRLVLGQDRGLEVVEA
ncbi:MAG: phage tail sheath family protein [Micromonosporaceae bacterium]|nr:phage tail sheath family protein [Micromonosporaceae bacterium]